MNKKLFLVLFCMVNFSIFAMENAPENEQHRKLSDSFRKLIGHERAFYLHVHKNEPGLIPQEYRVEGAQSKEDYYRQGKELQKQLAENCNDMGGDGIVNAFTVKALRERAYEQVKREFSGHIGCPNKIAEIFPH